MAEVCPSPRALPGNSPTGPKGSWEWQSQSWKAGGEACLWLTFRTESGGASAFARARQQPGRPKPQQEPPTLTCSGKKGKLALRHQAVKTDNKDKPWSFLQL